MGKGRIVRRGVGYIAIVIILAGVSGCTFFGNNGPDVAHWEPQLSPDETRLAYESSVNDSLELFYL